MREIRTSGSMRGERTALRCRPFSYSTLISPVSMVSTTVLFCSGRPKPRMFCSAICLTRTTSDNRYSKEAVPMTITIELAPELAPGPSTAWHVFQ